MQGIATLQDPKLKKALSVSSVKAKDLPNIARTAGQTYQNLAPEQKQGLDGLAKSLSEFTPQELIVFDRFLTFIKQHPDKYKEIVADLYRRGLFEPGELPEEYNDAFFSTVHVMVVQTIENGPKGRVQEQQFAKGGIASIHAAAEKVRAAGRDGDTILAHINPREAELLRANGGSGSINPKTGLPEYKSFFSKIGKFLGAAAPMIGNVIGGFFGMPFLGTVLGGAVGGLVSGGGVKGALVGAAMAGIGSLAMGGFSSLASGGGFMEGVTGTLPSWMGGSGETFGGSLFGSGASASGSGVVDSVTGQTPVPQARPTTGVGASDPSGPAASGSGAVSATPKTADNGSGIFKTLMDNKGLVVGAGLGALALGSMGGKDKAAPASLSTTHADLTPAERAAKYPWTQTDQEKFFAQPTSTFSYDFLKSSTGPGTEVPIPAKHGGQIDARVGGHMGGPGTGTSDSIPAKLSDGEFVMTAKAVRGAGNGDRMAGARKMYDLMHKFERVA